MVKHTHVVMKKRPRSIVPYPPTGKGTGRDSTFHVAGVDVTWWGVEDYVTLTYNSEECVAQRRLMVAKFGLRTRLSQP